MSTARKTMPTPNNGASAQENPWGVVDDYPISSVLVVFAIGLGAGMALGSLLTGPVASQPSLGRRTAQGAEQLGRQMLNAITGVLPESMAKHIEV